MKNITSDINSKLYPKICFQMDSDIDSQIYLPFYLKIIKTRLYFKISSQIKSNFWLPIWSQLKNI